MPCAARDGGRCQRSQCVRTAYTRAAHLTAILLRFTTHRFRQRSTSLARLVSTIPHPMSAVQVFYATDGGCGVRALSSLLGRGSSRPEFWREMMTATTAATTCLLVPSRSRDSLWGRAVYDSCSSTRATVSRQATPAGGQGQNVFTGGTCGPAGTACRY
jgi:hypothetical protein